MTACPLCASPEIAPAYQAAGVPVYVNKVYPDRRQAMAAPRGDIDLWRCGRCGFAWNRAYDPSKVSYDASYENSLAHSPAFAAHMRARAEAIANSVSGESRIDYLEVGCGQGQFIALVAGALGGKLASAQGFDPAWRGETSQGPGSSRIHGAPFNDAALALIDPRPNVIVARHCIEYFPSPQRLLANMRASLSAGRTGYVFIETAGFDSLRDAYAPLDIVYERQALFGERTLATALAVAGFNGIHVERVFDGQYLWATARSDGRPLERPANETTSPVGGEPPLESLVPDWRRAISRLHGKGPVALWGAGARGIMLCNLADPDAASIAAVIDTNPGKQGGYVPVTGHRITGPDQLKELKIATVIVTNSRYRAEIETDIRSRGLTIETWMLPGETA